MNTAWYLFYGRQLAMSKQEILCTRIGEMRDMIACLSIFNGAKPKTKQKKLSFLETLEVM